MSLLHIARTLIQLLLPVIAVEYSRREQDIFEAITAAGTSGFAHKTSEQRTHTEGTSLEAKREPDSTCRPALITRVNLT